MRRWWRALNLQNKIAVVAIVMTLLVGVCGALPAYWYLVKDSSGQPVRADPVATTAGSSISSDPSPIPPTPTNTVAPVAPCQATTAQPLIDTFSDTTIEPFRWLLSKDAGVQVFEANGRLNFVVPPPNRRDVGATLTALPDGRPVEDAALCVRIAKIDTKAPGGVGLTVELDDGRRLRVDAGPGSDDPGTDIYVCAANQPNDCKGKNSPDDIDLTKPTELRIRRVGQGIDILVNSKSYYTEPRSATITHVEVHLYADSGSAFAAEVDNFYLKPAL